MNKKIIVLLSFALLCNCTGCGNLEKMSGTTGSAETTKNQTVEAETTENQTTACEETTEGEETTEAKEAENTINPKSGTPWIDSELIGAVDENTQTDLKDDFALAVNKDWILEAEIPAGYSNKSSFTDVSLTNDTRFAELMTIDNKDNDQNLEQVQSLYNLFLDWDGRNEAGITPILPMLEQIEAIKILDDLSAYLSLSLEDRYNCDYSPADVSIGFDRDDASRYSIDILSRDLLVNDSAEYDTPTDYGQLILNARLLLARKVLKKAGYTEDEIDTMVEGAQTYEKLIASSIYTSDEKQASDYAQKTNNKVTIAELKELQGNYPLVASLAALGINTDDTTEVMLFNPGWLTALSEIYTEDNVRYFCDEMIVRIAYTQALYLDEECFGWYEEYIQTVNGTTESADYETEACAIVSDALVWPMTRAYCNRYVTKEDKERIYGMCEDIIAEYKEMIKSEDWLSDETKDYACEKLDSMQVFALFPDDDKWPETADFDFKSKDEGGLYWTAINSVNADELEFELGLADETVDRSVWGFYVDTMLVNAGNYPECNAMYIFAGIAQGIFYNSDMSDEELYASMGTVIGHEISHAFDSAGSQYDKDGNLSNWWTEEDLAAFEEKNQKMIDYYNTISPWEGANVHGSIITGEAGADMAGVKVMLRLAEKIEDFDYDLFFRTYAGVWKSYSTQQREEACLRNAHPMSYLRINVTLAQFDEFYETYDIKEGDGMYIAPEDRVIVW